MLIHLAGHDAEDCNRVEKIVFHGQVWSVKTRVDGGIVVSLDLPENEIMPAAEFMELNGRGLLCNLTRSFAIRKINQSG